MLDEAFAPLSEITVDRDHGFGGVSEAVKVTRLGARVSLPSRFHSRNSSLTEHGCEKHRLKRRMTTSPTAAASKSGHHWPDAVMMQLFELIRTWSRHLHTVLSRRDGTGKEMAERGIHDAALAKPRFVG